MSDDALGAPGPDSVGEKVAEWIRSAPAGRACVVEDVERFRDATVQERVDAFRTILGAAEAFARDLERPRDDDETWLRWMDPGRGRPR